MAEENLGNKAEDDKVLLHGSEDYYNKFQEKKQLGQKVFEFLVTPNQLHSLTHNIGIRNNVENQV